MSLNTFIRKASIGLSLLLAANYSITYCMMENVQSFDPLNLLTTIQDNKAIAVIAGIGVLGTGLFSYTTYNFWQKNKALQQQLDQKEGLIAHEPNMVHAVVQVNHPNTVILQQLEQKAEELLRIKKINIKHFQKRSAQFRKNNKELRTLATQLKTKLVDKEKKLQSAHQRIEQIVQVQNQHEERKAKKILKEQRRRSKIPFISNLDIEEKRKTLEEEFVALTISAQNNDQELLLEGKNSQDREKVKEEDKIPQSMTASLEITQGEKVFDESENFKFYSFHPIHIINHKKTTDKKLIVTSVHGTFVNADEYGKDLHEGISQDIIEYAKALARDQKCDVIILPFEWSGALNELHRQEAGKVLAENIKRNCTPDQRIFAITHSHGGNVLLHAAEALKDWAPIEEAYLIAPPIADTGTKHRVKSSSRTIHYGDKDLNILRCYCLYSTADTTQAIGSSHTTSWIPLLGGNFERRIDFEAMSKKCKIWNIRIQDNGYELNHISIITPVIKSLKNLIPLVRSCYRKIHDLDANFSRNYDLPQVAIRNLVRSPGLKNNELNEAIEKSDQAALQFEEEYGRNIKDKVSYTVVNVISEAKDAISNVAGKIATRMFSWESWSNYFGSNSK